MSWTIPLDGNDIDRRLENVVNRVQRHCKIVRVRQKPQPAPALSNPFNGLVVKQSYPPLMNLRRG
jgi:hypothetical protein